MIFVKDIGILFWRLQRLQPRPRPPLQTADSTALKPLFIIAKIAKKIHNLEKFKYFCTKITRKR